MRKRLLFILSAMLLSVVAVAQRHSYAEESVLREGNVVKIRVKETGIHAVTYDELKKWGLQPEQVRWRSICIREQMACSVRGIISCSTHAVL